MTCTAAGWALFVLLLVFNLIFFGFDAYPIVERKIARIGIGTLDEGQFKEAVVAQCVRLLENPPRFRLNDETRYLFFEHLAGQMTVDPARFGGESSNGSRSFLTDDTSPMGLLADGVIDYASHSENSAAFLPPLVSYASRFMDGEKGLRVKPTNVEQTGQGTAMLYLADATGDASYMRAADEIAAFYLGEYQKTGQPIPYTIWGEDRLILVDTLGIMCPFLARYGAQTGSAEATDLAVFQLEDFFAKAVDAKTGLPFHGYNPVRGDGLTGVACWGRGSGWLALGLQQVVRWLPENHPRREILLERYRSYAKALHSRQREDGTWGTMANLQQSQWDTSATAMLCHFFLYGRLAGILGPQYDTAIDRAMSALRRNTRRDGTLDFAQGPVADLIRHSQTWGPNLFGQGALMSCLALLPAWEKIRAKSVTAAE